MSRAITGKVHKKRARKVLKMTKGYRGSRSKLFRVAKNAMMHGLEYAYVGRKLKKRNMRQLWIARINAACRNAGIVYSKFIDGLKKSGIIINRKYLSNLAITDIDSFNKLIEKAKQS